VFGDPATVARKAGVLRQHCVEVGRDPAEVSVSHLSTVLVGDDAAQVRSLVELTRPARVSAERHARTMNAGTVEQHVDRVGRFVDAGVDHVIVSLADLTAQPDAPSAALRRYGRVIDACRAL
jgi:alkanesulfonate monooxygenase SsuD/methylene tetrahydromethanopterin reductase-like flavin-dependent oxidoreductase (luciferase family)